MRLFWLDCLMIIGLICVYHSIPSKGFTIKIKIKEDVVLKITLVGKKENETDTNSGLAHTDKEQWLKLRNNMIGNSPEENIDNKTSLFDRIVVVNAFARSEAKDKKFLYQGDILMDFDGFQLSGEQKRKKRAVIAFEYFRWNVIQGVPYKLHESLDDASRRVILSAMREWEQSLPCIKWRVKTDKDVDFVRFFKGEGCYSQVGRKGGEQLLSIGKGCEVHGIALHEMGHALGIFHEQSRPDRDNYVNIIKENILEGFDTQFEKLSEDFINSYNIDYDYSSIMHYSATAFAREKGLITIEPRPKRDVKFGQREHLSAGDIRQARAMYGCEDTEYIATPASTKLAQTTKALTATQEAQVTETKQTTTHQPTTSSPTTSKPATTPQPTTSESVTTPEAPTTSEFVTTPRLVTKPKPVTTPELVITSEPVTTPEPTTQFPTEKPKVCVDLLPTCYKWIRNGDCSQSSPNYCVMKYFCSRTCEIWRNSALSKGATCVDLDADCEAKALIGQCTHLDHREYMQNMCCESCRDANCIDEDRFCAIWASSEACTTFSYLQKYCKKSCNICDV